ncbi:MAG TPA: GcrA family cell cycle regulator [Alphaproteobacteria bacterium]|nr:GcrA family cell cycle regulator [Alphaproteobacteria bacterium]
MKPSKRNGGSWSAKDDALLRRLRTQGLTVEQISKHFNGQRTPGAVQMRCKKIGIKGRMGKPAGAVRTCRKIQPKPMAPRKSIKGISQTPDLRFLKPVPLAPGMGTPMNELRRDQCRWPFGDPFKPEFRWCAGQAAPEASYCPYHQALAFRTFKEPRENKIPAAAPQHMEAA